MLHQYEESMKKSISLYEELRKNTIQIQKDIDRTQSESITFQNKEFKEKIKNILMCYSYEDP